MVTKAALFLVVALSATLGLWFLAPNCRTLAYAALLGWAAARLYYFLFYVLETYVDPTLRYSGVVNLARELARRRRAPRPRPSGNLPSG